MKLYYNKHCRVEVGAYVQTHEEPTPSSDADKHRTTGAIALEENDNLQSGNKFLSLTTGRVLGRHNFTIFPITQDMINRVHELAAKEESKFVFTDRNNNIVQDDNMGDSELRGVDSNNDNNNNSDSDYSDSDLEDVDWSDEHNNVVDNSHVNNNYNEVIIIISDNDHDGDDDDIQSLQSELSRVANEYDALQSDLDTVYEADNEYDKELLPSDDNESEIYNNNIDEHQNLGQEKDDTQF